MNEKGHAESVVRKPLVSALRYFLHCFLPCRRILVSQSKSVKRWVGFSAPRGAWSSVGPAPPAIEASIAIDTATRTVYIASLGGGILKSKDGGQTFAAVNQGLDSPVVGHRWLWRRTIPSSYLCGNGRRHLQVHKRGSHVGAPQGPTFYLCR